MSFFVKGKSEKRKYASITKYQKQGGKKKGSKRKAVLAEKEHELSSDDNEDSIKGPDESSSESELETAQEKKLRLAKVYLGEIEKEEQERLDNEDISDFESGDLVSKRLKLDYLKQVGKLKTSVANQYTGANISNIKILKCSEHRSTVTCICLSSDNSYIFSGSKDGSIVKWSLQNCKKVASIPFTKKVLVSTSNQILGHNKQIMCLAVSFDDKFLVVGDTSNHIQVWNVNNLKHLGTLKGHCGAVTGIALRTNTHTLYSCSKDRSVKVWSLDEMSYVETLYGHQDGITAISALSRERAVTSGGRDGSIRIWKIAEESQLIYNGHSGSIDVIRLINEDNFISGGDDGQICIWSAMKKKPLCSEKEAHHLDSSTSEPLWITAVASLINTDLVATGSYDGFVKVWMLGENFRSIKLLFTVEVLGFINDLSFTADGKYLIAAVGCEHRFGRWKVIKNAKNCVTVIPLIKSL